MKRILLLIIISSVFVLSLPFYVNAEEIDSKKITDKQIQNTRIEKVAPDARLTQKINTVIADLSTLNQEIKKNNRFSHLIPIIVVIIAGILALFQVKANIISSARIEWTQNLRKTLSLFLSEVMNINLHLREIASKDDDRSKEDVRADYVKQYDNFKKVNEYANQIKLFLNNQNEKDHLELQEYIDKYVDKATKDSEFDDVDYLDDMQNRIIETSQKLLKDAWEDAKTFKLRDILKFKI